MSTAPRHSRRPWRSRLRDLAVYCAIGVGLVSLIIIYGNYQLSHHEQGGLPLKWIGFAILTALVFGNTVRFSPDRRHSRRFWTTWAILLAAHLAGGILILLRITRIGMLQFFIILPFEYILLDRLLNIAMKPEEQN